MNCGKSCCVVLYCLYAVAVARAYFPYEPRKIVSWSSVNVNAARGWRTVSRVVLPAVFCRPTPGVVIGAYPVGHPPNAPEAALNEYTGACPGAAQYSRL